MVKEVRGPGRLGPGCVRGEGERSARVVRAVRTQLTTALSVFPPFIIHERLDAHPTGWQKRRLTAESRRRARQES